MIVGYARVSSTGQSLVLQLADLQAAGASKIFSETRSGRTAADRPELAQALDWIREGDTLLVTRLDRLARSVGDLAAILKRLEAKGVTFRCLHQGAIETATPSGRLMLHVLGAIAEFENDLRRERQKEGIEAAKAKGVYRGRKPSIFPPEIQALHAQGLGATEIARRLQIGRASVYRALNASQ